MPRARHALALTSCLTLAPAAGARPAGAQPAPPRAFITRRGNDTLAIETVERAANGVVTSRLTFRGGGAPAGLRVVTDFAPAADGRVRSATGQVFTPGATTPTQRTTLTFGAPGDSVDVRVGDAPPRRVAAPAGALPFSNLAVASYELLLRRARALTGGAGRAVDVPLYFGPNIPAPTATVTRARADSAVVTVAGVAIYLRVGEGDEVRAAVVPAQGLLTLPADPRAVGALPAPTPAPPPNYDAPPGAPYAAEDVRIPTPGGFALAGTLTRPTAARGPVPVVVTITGSGPEDRDEHLPGIDGYALFRQIADTLGRRGIGVLRLDDRGVGASGGTFATATSADFADDVRAALAWLRARAALRGDVDARRLALLGHSEGGMIAPLVAAGDPGVAALVLMAGPAYNGRRILTYQFRRAILADSTLAPPRRDSLLGVADRLRDSTLAGTPWARYFGTYEPLATARRVRTPTLVLQGATDRQVTREQADTLAAALRAGGSDVTVRVFPDTDHLFLADPSGAPPGGYASLPSKSVRPEVLGAVADWLATRLAAGAR